MVVCFNSNNSIYNTPVYTRTRSISNVSTPELLLFGSNISDAKGVNDTFTSNKINVAKRKFEALFPNGEINKIYDKINKDFQVDNPAKLNLIYDKNSDLGGGYTYRTNSIDMNLADLIESDKKIVGIKDGRKIPLVNPRDKLPLFINEEMAKVFVDAQNQNGALGFDKLIYEDVTPKEQRKFIVQKIAHECVHARQHQILRETEGITDKDIIKAWTHKKPTNLIEVQELNQYADQAYTSSAWINVPEAETKYKKGTPMYDRAMIYLDAIRNYPPVTSPEYSKNALEREAFDISAMYVRGM